MHKYHEGNYFKFECGATVLPSGMIKATVTVTFPTKVKSLSATVTVGEFIQPDGFDPKDWPKARPDLYWKLCGAARRKVVMRVFGDA